MAVADLALTDEEAGREAAERLVHEWPVYDLEERDSVEFARAAITRLAELMEAEAPLFKEGRRGSRRGAVNLNARAFQGILETLQNGDDLGATELRLSVRRAQGGRRELLIVHNGAPITLAHVGAMAVPWVTTKLEDVEASGRFGIGQELLKALGSPIEAHCPPYHFRMDEEPSNVEPIVSRQAIYDATRRETAMLVPVDEAFDQSALANFLHELGSQALVFLRSIRRLALLDFGSGRPLIDYRLQERGTRQISVHIEGSDLEAEVVELVDPERRQRYFRYTADVPVGVAQRRRHKKTGATTTVGVALPARPERGQVYDRLPTHLPYALTAGLSAQFDPETGRAGIMESEWNAQRFRDLGDLLGAAALDVFERRPSAAWAAVPLTSEVPEGISAWLHERYAVDVIARAHTRLVSDLRLGEDSRPLEQLVYEEEPLDGILTPQDQEILAPEHAALPSRVRDQSKRWRAVLADLNRSLMLDVEDALDLLEQSDDDLGHRDPTWFVAFARAAENQQVFQSFCKFRGVALADGKRTVPPPDDEPRSLVQEEPSGLAARLGLALQIHPSYLSRARDATLVRKALERDGLLRHAYTSDDAALRLLARGTRDPLELSDRDLLALRDAFERLSDEDQRTLGPRIGTAILLRGFHYDETGSSHPELVRPAQAYLPKQIDRETDSFAVAAAETPDIPWLSADYRKLLTRRRRTELGPQKFLGRLGAEVFPRLWPPETEQQRYTRDPRRTSEIYSWLASALQMTEVRALVSPNPLTHLIGDRWSPELDAVLADMASERLKTARRRRAKALLGMLARGWDRHFADHTIAQAAWGYDGYWNVEGEVVATWLARAASEEWAPSATGVLHAPHELHLPTEQNKLAVGATKNEYLMPLDDQVARSPALEALRFRRGPSASRLVEVLEELRDEAVKPGTHARQKAHTVYRVLALACPPAGTRGRPVDDLTIPQLRQRFNGGRRRRGLILSGSQWYRPDQIFRGPPIFANRRPFVPQSPHLEPLWLTLDVPLPTARDAIEVLRELAGAPLEQEGVGIIIEAMPVIAQELDEMSPQLRGQLKALPLWTGTEWRRSRPIYAIDDDSVADALAAQVPVWQPGFSFEGLSPLLEALDVTFLGRDAFEPVVSAGLGAAEGIKLRPQWVRAVEHLRNELARKDHELAKSMTRSWDELVAARVIVDPDLEVAARVGTRTLTAPARAHLLPEPLTIFVRSAEDLGSADGAGQAVAALFTGDRQKVAWAWPTMWLRAHDADVSGRIVLSTDMEPTEDDDGLGKLFDQAEERKRRRKGKKATGKAPPPASKVKVRKIKDIALHEPGPGQIINPDAPKGGYIVPEPKKVPPGPPKPPAGPAKPGRQRTVLPPMTDREQLAYDAVMRALRLDDGQVQDLRQRRGIGADAIDELRQWFEIKMDSGAQIPAQVKLTPTEIERARSNTDFFLAVVSGLEEEQGQLTVRFIFNPLEQLPLVLKNDLTFGGVRDATALEYVFEKTTPPSKTRARTSK